MNSKHTQNRSMDSLLKSHALQTARGLGALLGISVGVMGSVLMMILIWVESFRYFSPETKGLGLSVLGTVSFLSILGITIYFWMLKAQKLSSTKQESLAKKIGENIPEVGDQLLNAVQLSRTKPASGISNILQQAAVHSGLGLVDQIPENLLFPKEKIKRFSILGFTLGAPFLLLYLFNFQEMNQAAIRLSKMNTRFEYPLPAKLKLHSDASTYLAGDTLLISGRINGRSPEFVTLTIQSKKDTTPYRVPVVDQQFELPLEHVIYSFTALAEIGNDRPWEPWSTIASEPLKVQVINRPVVQDLKIRIRPPGYTRLPIETSIRDILDISGLKGSRISIEGLSSKELKTATMHFMSGGFLKMRLDGNRFKAEFELESADEMWIHLEDEESVTNLEPRRYPIYVADDASPLIRVVIPAQDVIIGENQSIATRVKIDDDFGFSRLELMYQIMHPDYLLPDTNIYAIEINLLNPEQSSQEVDYSWDVSATNLMPEDAIQYWFKVWDNNTVDGPRSALSKKWMARLPSLDEMFQGISEGNDEIRKEQEEVLEIVQDIKEKVDELALEVQKNPQLDWSQQQEVDGAIEQIEDLKKHLEQISEQLDEMVAAAEDQNLFSEETLDKYSELQEMMEKLITPELLEAMQRLQQAIQENRPEQIELAMEEFQSAMENFEKSLERTLEIFKQVEIEQKLDEVTKRLNDLANRQEELAENMDTMNPRDAAQIEEKIAEDFNAAEQAVEDLGSLFEEHEDLSSNMVEDLQRQMSEEEVQQKLENTVSSAQAGQMASAQGSAKQASKSMSNIAMAAEQMRGAAKQMMMEDVLSDFREILHSTLRLSQAQEQLEFHTSNVSGQSSLIREYADEQMNLQNGLKNLAERLQALGEKTFAVSPSMGKSAGAVQAHMTESIRQMEARNPRSSAQSQQEARENLNRMALQISNSMQALEQSGEASGLSDYLQQLQSMSGQQQGLNQETLMQMGMGSNAMMQELARRQMQLRETLSQIEQGMGSDSRMLGDLGKIGDEMEEVAKELKKKRPSQRVHEQQERILSRLLDAQRSATQRDFSKQRKSETARTSDNWRGTMALPEDLGEARNLLYEELLYSLKQDYSREEKQIIRGYLNRIEEALNDQE